ncbi:hypothetical protein V8D89_011601 [Ganoderma adspersum]
MLLRSQNPAYIAATHRIEVLSSQIQQLEGQIAGQKQALAEVLSKVPMLIGVTDMQRTPESGPPSTQSHSPCPGKPVLGLGLQYLAAPRSRPPGIRYWTKEEQSGRPKGAGAKPGQHKNSENVGQAWIEDEKGNIIEGYVTAQIREMLTACFHSLVWSGQATSSARKLGHEARVYIHSVLGHHFPYLVICEGGQWKINELISTNYSSFTSTHLGRKTRKCRRADSTSSELEIIDAPGPKAPQTFDSSHDTAAASSAPPTNLPLHHLLEPGTQLYTLNDDRSTSLSPGPLDYVGTPEDTGTTLPQPSASLPLADPQTTLPSSEQPSTHVPGVLRDGVPGAEEMAGKDAEMCAVASSALSMCPDTMDVQMLSGTESAPLASPLVASSIAVASTIPMSGLTQIPVPKPFGVTKRRTRQTEPQAAASTSTANPLAPPTSITVSSILSSSAAPSPSPANSPAPSLPLENSISTVGLLADQHPSQAIPATQRPANTSSADAVANTLTGPSGGALTSTLPQSSRRRAPAVKASAKYKPGTVSAQNFHMRDRIDENPDVTYAECQVLFKALSPEQRQIYHEKVAAANKQVSTNSFNLCAYARLTLCF